MGEKTNGESRKTGKSTDWETTARSEDTETARTETGRTAGRAVERTTGRTTGTSEEKIVSEVAMVDPEEQKRQERNAKRRARYAEQKAKPKKVGSKKKQSQEIGNVEQVKAVITMLTAIVSSRADLAYWQLTPTEIDSLAIPIAELLGKSESFEKLGEHSDAIALFTACLTIFVPRILILLKSQKNKKELKKRGVSHDIGRVTGGTGEKCANDENGEDSFGNGKVSKPDAVTSAIGGEDEFYIGNAISF